MNRLIGDEQLPRENEYGPGAGSTNVSGIVKLPDWYLQGKPRPSGGRVAFVTWSHYDKESLLLESGLVGPVRLLTAVRRAVEG